MNSKKYWHQLSIDIDAKGTEALSNYLFQSGSCGLEESEAGIVAYFEDSYILSAILEQIEVYLNELKEMGIQSHQPVCNKIPIQNWNEEWQAYFKPVHVSDGIVVKPPWEAIEASSDQLVIDIMPKMAFGTGTHETTQLCLQFLESTQLDNKRILDAGTGSGILSIAAILLGATSAIGVDVDPESIENAYENAELNGVSESVHFQMNGLQELESPFDLIVANINRVVLADLVAEFIPLAHRDTLFIFSGILASEDLLFQSALEQHNFHVEKKQVLGEWIAYCAFR